MESLCIYIHICIYIYILVFYKQLFYIKYEHLNSNLLYFTKSILKIKGRNRYKDEMIKSYDAIMKEFNC